MTLRHTSPLKAFEAMAAGRPILASDLPSSREFLRHGENAWLVAPDDPAALAEGLARLLEDDALSERIARTAFEDAVAFSWDARARRLMDVFAEIA
jgi:glycosyltransferase involved in cell wall biosynthesis